MFTKYNHFYNCLCVIINRLDSNHQEQQIKSSSILPNIIVYIVTFIVTIALLSIINLILNL